MKRSKCRCRVIHRQVTICELLLLDEMPLPRKTVLHRMSSDEDGSCEFACVAMEAKEGDDCCVPRGDKVVTIISGRT